MIMLMMMQIMLKMIIIDGDDDDNDNDDDAHLTMVYIGGDDALIGMPATKLDHMVSM